MLKPSLIELSQSALAKNIKFLRGQVGPGVQFCSVVKGNAYGHHISTFIPMAEKCGIQRFAVFSADEAEEVLDAQTRNPDVIIMGPLLDDATAWAVARGISFFASDVSTLQRALAAARVHQRPAGIHLELETGLNRTGLERADLERAVALIRDHSQELHVKGVCTHFAGAESVSNYVRIQQQKKRFNEGVQWLRAQGVEPGLRHMASSAAALSYPETCMDLVRIGIAQYGFWPSKETRMSYLMRNGAEAPRAPDPLQRVLTWKSRVSSMKRVGRGEFVGYGTSYLTESTQRIATVPVGYAAGFSRRLSNVGRVLIRGRRFGVVGVVNMSMLLVDVTEAGNVEVGDEVVLIGKQNRLNISVSSFSDAAGYLNYESLVKLDCRIPRTVVA
jgi:alanine racemase